MKQIRMLKVIMILNLLFLCACAGQNVRIDSDTSAQKIQADNQVSQSDTPLDNKYDNIVFYNFESTPDIKNYYPEAPDECMVAAISQLLMKNRYKNVAKSNGSNHDGSTLLIKTKISEMRIVSRGARIWVGVFAGSSYINIEVEFIDAESGTQLRKKTISRSNNVWVPDRDRGSTDERSLPTDMGKILAEYILATVPATY
jgi:hypothetical protein